MNENIRIGANMTSFDEAMESSAKKAEKSFQEIVDSVRVSGANVKKELRQITGAMTSMLAQGVNPASEEFQRLAKRAGELKDAIADANEEIQAQANDTRDMTLAFGALQDGMSGFQAAQAAMSLFGAKSEEAAEAMKKMMAAQQLMNSVQQLGNSLTSKSTLLGQAYASVKGLLTAASGAQATAEGTAAAATTGLAAAEGGATVATTALTVAINALPFVAATLAAVAFAGILSELVSDAKETAHELEITRATTQSLIDANGAGAKSFMTTSLELEKYQKQITSFNGTAKEEKKLVEELNKKYGDTMGQYSTLSDWKKTLISQSDSYCKMLAEEAKAQALSAKMAELYVKQVTGEISFKDYTKQVETLKDAWNNALEGVQLYKTILKTTPRVNEVTGGDKKTTPKGGGGKSGGTPKSLTETIHDMAQLDKLIADTNAKMSSETDLAKKYEISQQLQQLVSFRKTVQDISNITTAPGSGTVSDLAGLGLPEATDLKSMLGPLSEVLDEFNANQLARLQERLQEQRQAIADFKEGLSGDIGGMVEEFSMLAKVFEDEGLTAESAAAGLVVMGNALKQLGSSGPVAKAGAMLAAVGQIILGFAQASAQASSLGPFGWLAFVGAGLAAVATTIAQIQSFHSGGIVRGAGAYDSVPTMLTPGEAVLTRNDQAQLWRMLKTGGGTMGGGEVRLRIHGTDLVGVLNNYGDVYGKID